MIKLVVGEMRSCERKDNEEMLRCGVDYLIEIVEKYVADARFQGIDEYLSHSERILHKMKDVKREVDDLFSMQ